MKKMLGPTPSEKNKQAKLAYIFLEAKKYPKKVGQIGLHEG